MHHAADGGWSIQYKCSHHAKCSCPFGLEIKHERDSPTVVVMQTQAHCFHDPASAADRAQLRMHPELQQRAEMLLSAGCKPERVRDQLNERQRSNILANGGSLIEHASNARNCITLPQVYALQKQLRRTAGFGLTSDAAAVSALAATYHEAGWVAYYQAYKAAGHGDKEQPLIIIVQTPFQQRMLSEFGRRMVFLDATGSTNKYGYPVYAAVVSAAKGQGSGWSIRQTSGERRECSRHIHYGVGGGSKPLYQHLVALCTGAR